MPRKKIAKKFSRKLSSVLIVVVILILGGMIFWKITAKAAEPPWATSLSAYAKRQKISLVNNSAGNLAANTTVAVTVNTKALYGQNSLKSDCGDLRVAYQPSASSATELTRSISYSGAATCTTSENTIVNFNLQASLNAAATSNDYYIYYNNLNATVPTNTDNAFDLSSKNATLICPFDGSSTCAAAETPSTDTGTARYSGSKTAGLFDGHASKVFGNGGWDGLTEFTAEMWVNTSQWNVTSTEPYLFAEGTGNSGAGDGWRVLTTNSNRIQTDIEIGGVGLNYQSDSLPDDGAWHHVALVYNGSSINFYIDGVPGTPDAVSGTVNGTATTFYLGSSAAGNVNFQGKMDEFRISTIARYSSTFTPSTAPFVRDQFTQVLYHFDENGDDPRNTGIVLDDSGNGNHGTATSIAYSSGLVGIDSSTSDTGNVVHQSYADHAGRFIEEGTTNKFTNPSFENSGNHHQNWTNNCSSNPDNAGFPIKFGSQKDTMITSSAANCQNYEGINAGNTNTHTLSAYVYRDTTGHIGDTVDSTVAQLYFNGAAQTTTYTNTGGGWWRLTYTGAAGAGTQNYGVQLNEDSGTIQVDGVQLEEKAYATTYADGSLGSGYSWQGTTNASASDRTADSLKYAISGNIAAAAGSVSFWIKPNWAGNDGVAHVFFDTDTSARSLKLSKSAANVLTLTDSTNNATKDISGWAANSWHHIVATWDGSSFLKVYVDSTAGTASGAFTAPTLTTSLYLGQDKTNANLANAEFSDLRIWDTVLTSTEVTAVYNAGLVSRSSNVAIDRFSQTKGQNPVAIWHLNESSGSTSYDATVNGNNLTLSNTTWNSQPANRYTSRATYLTFNNSTSYATQANSSNFNFGTGDFTLTGWFQHSTTAPASGSDVIFSRYGSSGYKVYMNTSGFVCFGIDDDSTWGPDDAACSTATQGSLADSKWHQFVVVKNGTSNIQIYIDNQLAGTDASISASSTLDSSAAIYLGIDSDATSNAWDGNLDEIVVYPYARSVSQIQTDYLDNQTGTQFGALPVDPLVQNLNGYWNMDTFGSVDLGQDTILSGDDTGNQARVYAQKATLATTGTVSSISFGVRTTGGQLQLGIYDDLSNAPHALLAHTAAFTPGSTGFQSANVTVPVTLTAGTYWIAYQAETSAMHYYVDGNGTYAGGDNTFGNGMPGTFPTIADSGSAEWSIFASLTTAATDSSGNGNNLTSNGGITSTGGKFGSAGTYDGSSKYFNSANTINGVSSVSFWAKPASTTDNFINLASGDYIKATSGTLSAPGFTNPIFYVNGVRTTTIASSSWQMVTVSSSTPLTANAFEVGRANGSYAVNNSLIDEVRTYNRTLTDTDVSNLYAWAPGPVGYWKFDENTGTTVHDYSGNGNNGTLSTASWGAGKFGGGLKMSTNDILEQATIPDPASGILDFNSTQSFTTEGWVNFGTIETNGIVNVVQKYASGGVPGYGMEISHAGGSGGTYCQLQDGPNNDTADVLGGSLNNNSWHYITCVIDRTGSAMGAAGLYIFVDGVYANSVSLTTGDLSNSDYVTVGEEMTAQETSGGVDDVKIYNYARSQKQVVQDMNGNHPAGGSPVGSAAFYLQFDDLFGSADNSNNCSLTTANSGYSGGNFTNFGGTNCIQPETDGKFGRALHISTNTIDRGSVTELDGVTGMTLSFWLKPEGTLATTRSLIGREATNQYNFLVTTGSSSASDLSICIYGTLTDTNCTTGATYTTSGLGLASNVWSYITIVYDGTQSAANRVKVYKNLQPFGGSITTGTTIPASMTSGSTQDLQIGGMTAGAGVDALLAAYDEFKIYPYAVTTDEMKIDYNHSSGLTLGSTFTDSNNMASNSGTMAFCPPGDSCTAPLSYWPLNENTALTSYDSGSNPSTLLLGGSTSPNTTDPKWVPGKMGTGLLFDGSNDIANTPNCVGCNVGDKLGNATAYTFEAWIKRRAANSFVTLGTQGSGGSGITIEAFNGSPDSLIHHTMGAAGGTYRSAGITSNDTAWHHVAFVYDGTQTLPETNRLKGYLDGVPQTLTFSGTAANVPSSLTGNNSQMYLGDCGGSCGEPTDGWIDDVRLYKYARTPTEVAWDMNRGAPVGWWEFDECAGNSAHDSSGNGNTGTLTTDRTVGTCGTSSTMWGDGATGKFNSSLGFDGTGDFAEASNGEIIDGLTEASVCVWINPDSVTNRAIAGPYPGGANAGWTMWLDDMEPTSGNTNTIAFTVGPQQGAGARVAGKNDSVTTGVWAHYCGVFKGGSYIRLYKNGILNNENTTSVVSAVDTNPGTTLLFGKWGNDTYFYQGKIDDLRIYNYALTAAQVTSLYNGGAAIRFAPATGAP